MLLKTALAPKSLLLVRLVGSAPGPNTRSSPAVGARSSCQLSLSVHRFVAPPPSHVRVAGTTRSSSGSNRGRHDGRGRRTGRLARGHSKFSTQRKKLNAMSLLLFKDRLSQSARAERAPGRRVAMKLGCRGCRVRSPQGVEVAQSVVRQRVAAEIHEAVLALAAEQLSVGGEAGLLGGDNVTALAELPDAVAFHGRPVEGQYVAAPA